MSVSIPPDIYRLIVGQMADAIIYTDTGGIIRGWNAAAEALFGYPRGEVTGQSLDLIIPERLRAAHWAGFNRAMACGTTQHGRRAVVTRSLTSAGDTIYVEISFAVVTDEEGKTIGAVAVARDATQRHHDDRALREQLAVLQNLHSDASAYAQSSHTKR